MLILTVNASPIMTMHTDQKKTIRLVYASDIQGIKLSVHHRVLLVFVCTLIDLQDPLPVMSFISLFSKLAF